MAGRRLDPVARRAQLVRLGLELIRTHPLDQELADGVVRAAGISRGLLFHYFPSKSDFQYAVIQAAADEILAAVQPDPSSSPLEQLHQGVDRYVRYVEKRPGVSIALARGAGSDERLLDIFEKTRKAVVRFALGSISVRPNAQLRLAVRGWVAFVEESTFEWLRDRSCSRTALVEFLYQTALHLFPLAQGTTIGAMVGGPAKSARAIASAGRPAGNGRRPGGARSRS